MVGEVIEGEDLPRFRIVVNGKWEPGGFATFDDAMAEVQRRRDRLGRRYQIADRRTIIWPAMD